MPQVEKWIQMHGTPFAVGIRVIVNDSNHHYLNHKGVVAGVMHTASGWQYLLEMFDGFAWLLQGQISPV
jgi:hypothetical protein